MNESIKQCIDSLKTTSGLMREIRENIGDTPIPRAIREYFTYYDDNFEKFKSIISSLDIDDEAAITHAKYSSSFANAIANQLIDNQIFNESVRVLASDLATVTDKLTKAIDSGDVFFVPLEKNSIVTPAPDLTNHESHISDLEKKYIQLSTKFQSDIENFEREIAKARNDIEEISKTSTYTSSQNQEEMKNLSKTAGILRDEIIHLGEKINIEVTQATKIKEESLEDIKKVQDQIDALLGESASKVLLVDYAATAEAEKISADKMRTYSLGCMGLSAAILCFTVYESIGTAFDWRQTALKIVIAIALSVPAAYLARESGKHRHQEHKTRKTSLDLRALSPYIATMTPEQQTQIKMDIAAKIFGSSETDTLDKDSYPIHLQEIVLSLIEKIPKQK